MAAWSGAAERITWGETDCGDVVTWDGGWRATRPGNRELFPSEWVALSRQFPTRQEAVDWLLAEAGIDRRHCDGPLSDAERRALGGEGA